MNRSFRPKISPAETSDNRANVRRPPTRRQIEGAARRVLTAGGPTKADVYVVEYEDDSLVIKDFAAKAAWVRLIGRIQISRECRAYRWLGPRQGVVPFVGRVDAHALALIYIDGERLAESERRLVSGASYHARLCQIVEEMHGAGLAHLDLRGRENVMLDLADRLWVLDLAAAMWFRPAGVAHRLFFRMFAVSDQAALLKWKSLLHVGPYTAEEQAFLARFGFWRSLWPFNRKRPTETREAGPNDD